MQPVKFLTSVIVLFVWGFAFDKFLAPIVYGDSMTGIPGMVENPSMQWIIIGSLVGSAVLVWFYEKVVGSFGSGAAGGAKFGLYTGILMNFPLWLFHTLYGAWPYAAMWHWTLVGIVMGVINGVLIGLVYDKVGGSKAA
jgi:hypothetical protein